MFVVGLTSIGGGSFRFAPVLLWTGMNKVDVPPQIVRLMTLDRCKATIRLAELLLESRQNQMEPTALEESGWLPKISGDFLVHRYNSEKNS